MTDTNKATETMRKASRRAAAATGGRVGPLLILLALVVAFSVVEPNFFSLDNLLNILRQYSFLMIIAAGQTLVIISRGIDLSVASTAALSGSVMAVAYAHWGLPTVAALALGMAAGVAVGAFNGFAITQWGVTDFVATLGTLVAVRGVALLVTDGLPVPNFERAIEGRQLPGIVSTLGSESVLRIPLIAVVALVCVLIIGFILSRTKLGRSAYAIGGNADAARVSGIRVGRSKMWIYIISGLLAAVAGFVLTGRQASANALMANALELQSIAAVVIGGTALFGGEGKVSGTVIGVAVIAVLANGLSILGVAEFWQQVFNGLIIVVVVALDQWRRRTAQSAGT